MGLVLGCGYHGIGAVPKRFHIARWAHVVDSVTIAIFARDPRPHDRVEHRRVGVHNVGVVARLFYACIGHASLVLGAVNGARLEEYACGQPK